MLNHKSQIPNNRKIAISKSLKKRFLGLEFGIWNLIVICNLGFGIFLTGCNDVVLHKEKRVLMGTFVEVVSVDPRSARIVFDEIARVEGILSKYNPDSQVSLLNRTGSVEAGPDLMFLLQQARRYWEVSEGAFDVTVGPLMDLWGFTNKDFKKPSEEAIKAARASVGFDKIIFTNDNNMVKFSVANMRIDLGALAKGYAVDCAVNKLRSSGITSCLVNAGGDIYCLGKSFGQKWRVAVQDPGGKGYADVYELENQAVATSGDYEQFFIKDNKRYAHIFDPRTGYPVQDTIASVTVIADTCVTADALATSLFVVGKEKAAQLIRPFANVRVKVINR